MRKERSEDPAVITLEPTAAVHRRLWSQAWPWIRKFDRFMALIVLSTAVALATPVFLRPSNLINVARQISINAVLAAGQTFVILTAGIDLSVGSVLAVGSIVSTDLAVKGMPFLLAMLVGLLAASILGSLNGVLVAKTKIPPFIVTLGTMNIGRGITYLWTGAHVVSGVPRQFTFAGRGMIGPVPVPVIIMLAVYIVGHFILTRTKFGRFVYAIGGNIETARLSGIDVRTCLFIVYTVCGALSGLGGLILAGRLSSGQPEAGVGYELDCIAAVVVGGTSFVGGEGSIWGTLIGAFTIGVLRNGLNLLNISAFWQQIAIGAVIIAAVFIDMLRRR